MESKAASDKESLTERLGQLDHLLKKRLDDFIKKYDGKVTKFKQLPSASDFETKYIISRGRFGEVHIVQKKISKDVYAMKILHKEKLLAHHEEAATIPINFGLMNHIFQTSKWKYLKESNRNCGLLKSHKSSKGLNFTKLANFFKPKSKHMKSSSNDVNPKNSEIEAIQMEFSSNCDVSPKKDTLHATKKLLTRQRRISSGDEEERIHQNSELGSSTNGSSDGNEFSEVSQKIVHLKTGDAELDKILQLQHDDGYWNLTEDIATATFNLPISEIKSRLGLQDNKISGTVVIIAWLRLCHEPTQEIWNPHGKLGASWLQKQRVVQKQAENLISHAIEALDAEHKLIQL